MLKNIIFDFDGTLGDTAACGDKAIQEAFRDFGLNVPAVEDLHHYMGVPIEVSFVKLSERELSEAELEELFTSFRAKYQEYEADYIRIFPGIKEMLENLSAKNHQLFIASSKHSEALLRNLEILGIKDYFLDTVGSDKVTKFKPDPESIEYLLNTHGLEASETLMVGDATFDLKMGNAAGVHTAGVTWGSHPTEKLAGESPTVLINKVSELELFIVK